MPFYFYPDLNFHFGGSGSSFFLSIHAKFPKSSLDPGSGPIYFVDPDPQPSCITV